MYCRVQVQVEFKLTRVKINYILYKLYIQSLYASPETSLQAFTDGLIL